MCAVSTYLAQRKYFGPLDHLVYVEGALVLGAPLVQMCGWLDIRALGCHSESDVLNKSMHLHLRHAFTREGN